MASEAIHIETFLRSLITATSGVTTYTSSRVYAYKPPQDATYPCVVYSHQSGNDTDALGTLRLLASPFYQIKIVDTHPVSNNGVAAAHALDNALKAVVASVSSGYVFSITRLQDISYIEPDKVLNKDFRHLGGLYKIDTHASA